MFERLFGKAEQKEIAAETKGAFPGISTIANFFSSRIFGGSSNVVDKYHSWTFRAVNLIAQEVGATTLRLYKKSPDGTKKEVTSHPLLDLLDNPNPEMSRSDILEWISAWLDIDGNGYLFAAKNGTIKELWPLRSDWVSTVPDKSKTRIVGGYSWYNGQDNIPLEVEEVIHFRNFNPKFYDRKNVGKGVGTLQAAMDFVEEDETIRSWNRQFFKNGAVTSGVLKYAGNLTAEQKTQIEAKWRQQNEGVENSNKVAILSGGVDWQPTQFNQRELAFIEQRKLDKDDIFLIYGVPKGLLMSDDVNLANAKQALWAFTRFTVRPRLKKIEEMLNSTLVKAFGENLVLEFDNPVPNDRDLELKEYSLAVDKWMTVNEVRAEEGLPPLDGGDELYRPQTGFPVPELPAEEEEPTKSAKAKKVTPLLDDERTVRGEKVWNEMLKRQKPFEDKYKAAFAKYFGEAKVRAIKALTETKSKAPKPLLEKATEVAFIIDFLTPLQKEYYEKQGRQALSDLGLVNDFVMSESLKKRLDKYNLKLAGTITDTTLEAIKNIVAEGIEDGTGTDAVAAEIGKYFEESQKYRADRIARSETILASNSATEEAWTQSGVVESKEWYTSKDERVCAYCDDMDGTTIDLSEKFFRKGDEFNGLKLDYRSIGEPPLHTQCRCVLLPVLK